MKRGVVLNLDLKKRFGFIKPVGPGPNLFFHGADCVCAFDALRDGVVVTYLAKWTPRGGRAQCVRPVTT